MLWLLLWVCCHDTPTLSSTYIFFHQPSYPPLSLITLYTPLLPCLLFFLTGVDGLFFAGTSGRLMLKSEDRVMLYDQQVPPSCRFLIISLVYISLFILTHIFRHLISLLPLIYRLAKSSRNSKSLVSNTWCGTRIIPASPSSPNISWSSPTSSWNNCAP